MTRSPLPLEVPFMFHNRPIHWFKGTKKDHRAMRLREHQRWRPRLEVLEDRRLPSTGIVSETPIPTANAAPGQVVVDAQGNQYFIETNANVQKIGKLTKAGVFTESPRLTGSVTIYNGVAPGLGPDGNIYFGESGRVGRISISLDPSTLVEDSTGIPPDTGLRGLTVAPDGNVYFTLFNSGMIGRLPTGIPANLFTQAAATLSGTIAGAGPNQITFAQDGNLYFTDYAQNKIGRIAEGFNFGDPFIESGAGTGTAGSSHFDGITVGPDGNIWFAETAVGRVGRIQAGFESGQVFPEFPLPTGDQPFTITVGGDGHLYTADGGENGGVVGMLSQIALNGDSRDITVTSGGLPEGISEAPDGNFFFTELNAAPNGNKIGKFNVQHIIVTGADLGHEPIVNVFNADTGLLVRSFYAYSPSFLGGVRVAMADINHDGVPDIITAPGGVKVTLVNVNGALFPSFDLSAGGPPEIKVFSGTDGTKIADFLAYPASFTAGVFVAVADVDGDGSPDIITGPEATGQPNHTNVRVFFGQHLINTGAALAPDREFNAYAPGFGGGVRLAAADFNGDGFADIVTAPGIWSGPDIRIFDGRSLSFFSASTIGEFLAYDFRYFGGVFVATGDVNGDGLPDIVTGTNGNGGPEVKAFSGSKILNNPTPTILNDFFAYDPTFNGGARVAVVDFQGDGKADIVTAPGSGGGPDVRVFDGLTPQLLENELLAYNANFIGGVFVGAF
jgi:streptogramin lyase